MDLTELKYTIALQQLKGVGNNSVKKLIELFGSPQTAFKAATHELIQKGGISAKYIQQWDRTEAEDNAIYEMERIEKHRLKAISIASPDYPFKLMNCGDAPAVLYYLGNIDFKGYRFVSIVGTRKATNYGLDLCKTFIKELKTIYPKIIIVSGMAAGVDTCAHKAAVENDIPTLAVLGHGLDTIYPASNRDLAQRIIKNGALLTEFSYESRIIPENFARRNRIVAGLADATIVVESALKGGSLITADLALNYNRDVFAFPGRAGDTRSAGCNYLIKNNIGGLIESAADFVKAMQWDESPKEKAVQKELFVQLSPDEEKVYSYLKNKDEAFVDLIAKECGYTMAKLSSLLLSLEFSGLVKSLPGKMYRII